MTDGDDGLTGVGGGCVLLDCPEHPAIRRMQEKPTTPKKRDVTPIMLTLRFPLFTIAAARIAGVGGLRSAQLKFQMES